MWCGGNGVTGSGKRLLWINHFAVAPGEGGGTRHFEMSRELVSRGWDVTVAASDVHLQSRTYTRRDGPDRPRVIPEDLDGVRFRWLWSAPYERNDWRRAWNWLSFARSCSGWTPDAGRPDVVIGSSPHLFAALAGLAARQALGRPVRVRGPRPVAREHDGGGRLEGSRLRWLRPDRAVALRPRRPDRVPRARHVDFLVRDGACRESGLRSCPTASIPSVRRRQRTDDGHLHDWSTPARTARPTASMWCSMPPSSSATARHPHPPRGRRPGRQTSALMPSVAGLTNVEFVGPRPQGRDARRAGGRRRRG